MLLGSRSKKLGIPTNPLTILESRNDVLYVVRKRRSPDFEALKLQKNWSGWPGISFYSLASEHLYKVGKNGLTFRVNQ